MRSIANKISLMLILALFISFSLISLASYNTAHDKAIELVIQTQKQIFDKSYAKGKKMRTDKNMEQIALRALF